MENIKEEVYKCSKCGLCQSVCPIYLATKNEMYLPRGRYIVLNNFFNNGKKLSKKFLNNLDVCLNCNLCKDFCPSDINSAEIFNNLKKIPKFFYLKLFLFFRFKNIFNCLKKYQPLKRRGKEKVIYFEGCYNRFVDAGDRNASIKLIEKVGYEVEKIVSNCCGYPYLTNGDYLKFEKNSKKIIELCNSNAKYIVCSCDSCYETLKRIDKISDKLIRLDKLLEQNSYFIPDREDVLYHRPLSRKENCYLPNSVKCINKKGSCSTMENFFAFKHSDVVNNLFDTVFYKKDEIQDKIVITTCQLDKIGLKNGVKKIKSNAKIYQYSEYICLLEKKSNII